MAAGLCMSFFNMAPARAHHVASGLLGYSGFRLGSRVTRGGANGSRETGEEEPLFLRRTMAVRSYLGVKFGVSGLLSQLTSSTRHHGRPCVSPILTSQHRNTSSSSSSSSSKVKVDLDPNTGVAVMHMQSPPVNSLSLDFITELCISLEKLEMDKGCRGLIITSSQPKVFSAGLDILEMYGKSPERCGEFWKSVQELWLKLYGSNMVTIAAVNGSSPAGGCLMALTCDYRIMADNPGYSIGLNETQLGIVAPFWFKDTLTNTIGLRNSEMALQLGLLYKPQDALKVGLVDQVVPEDQVLPAAVKSVNKWLAVPEHARQITKSMMRKSTIDRLTSNREADIQNFVSFITRESIQKSLRGYMELLKQKKA